MSMHPDASRQVLLQSPCPFAGRRLYLGRARLYATWMMLSGWHASGRYCRCISLADVEEVKWLGAAGRTEPNLQVLLKGGEMLSLHIRGAALWRLTIDAKLPRRVMRPDVQRRYTHRVLYQERMQTRGDSGAGVPFMVPGRPTQAAAASERTPDRKRRERPLFQ